MNQKEFIKAIRDNFKLYMPLTKSTVSYKCSDRCLVGFIHYAKFKCNGVYYFFKGYSFTENIYLCDDNFKTILALN